MPKTDAVSDQVHCQQVDDFSIEAPILPPDVRYIVQEKRTVMVGGTCHSRRAMYQDLMRRKEDKHKFCKNCRTHVTGALHQDVPSCTLKVD